MRPSSLALAGRGRSRGDVCHPFVLRLPRLAARDVERLVDLARPSASTATEPPTTTTAAKTATTIAPTTTTIPCVATATVDIKGGYKPQCASIAAGTTVSWTWSDTVFAHSVTSNTAGLFDSGVLEPGSTFEHTFTDAGTYQYHCTVHGRILHSGTIEVS